MPKIDVSALPWRSRTGYPEPLRDVVNGRERKAIGDAGGLVQFGVNFTRLKPGAATALRHWHEREDEFVYVLEGELVLVEDDGETVLGPGDAAAFKAGVPNGHHLVNRSGSDALLLEIGTRGTQERCHYPDVDLAFVSDESGKHYLRKSGEPY
jgi:uncharacterized cupin superfamily protein